ncbi:hypothetical protein [Bacillus sp. FSL K6-3431]|uniref:hypothetical protein n=1 Tax=Bacillus sp. FSL K6-3431 TaxID=2921500 RepID=UPI0030F93C16
MKSETELRRQLRTIGERYVQLSEDSSVVIEAIDNSTVAATCSKCSDYGNEVVETLRIVYSR